MPCSFFTVKMNLQLELAKVVADSAFQLYHKFGSFLLLLFIQRQKKKNNQKHPKMHDKFCAIQMKGEKFQFLQKIQTFQVIVNQLCFWIILPGVFFLNESMEKCHPKKIEKIRIQCRQNVISITLKDFSFAYVIVEHFLANHWHSSNKVAK